MKQQGHNARIVKGDRQMAGYLGGKIKGIPSSTDSQVEIPGQGTSRQEKTPPADYWYYVRVVAKGTYDVTARDITEGAGGNFETVQDVEIKEGQWTIQDFDIS